MRWRSRVGGCATRCISASDLALTKNEGGSTVLVRTTHATSARPD